MASLHYLIGSLPLLQPELEMCLIKTGLVSKINDFQLCRRTTLCQLLTGSWRPWEAVASLLFFLVYHFHGILGSTESRQTMCCFGWKVEHPQIVLKNLSIGTFATIFSITLPSAIAWWVRDHLLPLWGELTLCRCLYIYISDITCIERFKPVLLSPSCLALYKPPETINFKASTISNSFQNYLF